MAGHGGKPTDFVRKGLIVVLLFVGKNQRLYVLAKFSFFFVVTPI